MSLAFATLRKNVRSLIQDTDINNFLIKTDWLDREIIASGQELAANVFPGIAWSNNALSTTAGNPDATFTTGVAYFAVEDLRLDVDGTLLERSTEAEIESLRQSATPGSGKPDRYYLYENSSQVLTARFWPTPDATYTIDALMSSIPADSTSAAMPLSDLMLRAIEKHAAATVIAKMPGDVRDRCKVSTEVIQSYRQSVAALVAAERKRTVQLRGVGHIAPAVW